MPSAPPTIKRRLDWTRRNTVELQRPRFPWRRNSIDGIIILANPGAVQYVYVFTPTLLGNAPSRPKFTITLNATDYGITQIRLQNASLNPTQTLTIRRTFSPNEIIIIDSNTGEVSAEGVSIAPIDFFGQFLMLDPRAGSTNTIYLYVWATLPPTITPRLDWTDRYF